MLDLTTEENAVLLRIKVVPGASRTRCVGEWSGRARLAVAAPPEKGKANKAVVAFLADLLGVRKADVSIVSGSTSPRKTIRIAGASPADVRAALEPERI